MKNSADKKPKSGMSTKVPESISTVKHGGHTIRTGKKIVDRAKLGGAPLGNSLDGKTAEKQPNEYSGHTLKNNVEKFRLDGHKMLYHLDRVLAWQRGERIAPIHIDMGLTKCCNMGCIYCIGVTQGMKKGVMIDRVSLMRFIDDCGRLEVHSIGFIGDGEPTLNPALYDAVVRCKKIGIDTGIATNGLLLDMERADDLLRNATFVRINLSAAEPKSFQKIHQSKADNFDILIDKIRALARRKKEKNYDCTIGLQMVLIPENFDQVINLAKLGAEIGVDYLQIKQCSDTEYGELGINAADYKQVMDRLKEVEKIGNENYLIKVKWNKINILAETDVYKCGFRKYDICYGTPFLGQISGNGKVYPCGPFFGKERFCMGDITRESYFDIVKGDKYWKIHQDIVDNVDVHYDCTVGCRQDYINKFLWDIKNPPAHINFI